ncbi:GAF domain-containing protein [Sciscionella sediminilitoris]|uniref:GAF domain-containing protein n=1 Tax=Sciscionella sediminilitoris TaxID=1445613 RepID=UPI0004DF966A|nr:GAF domain-containing protein [Sciscionella sp. SE31]
MSGSTVSHLAADPGAQHTLLREVHEATLAGDIPPASPRSVISASWERSLAAHVDPEDFRPPIVYGSGEVDEVRTVHPLHAVVPVLREMLVSIADEAHHVMIVTDADGTILWREGAVELCRRADPVGLCEGTRWAEEAIGTNAMGTALALDAPVQIYSAEHLVRTYHSWTCAAAPIHDPDTGAVLGSIDISGQLDRLHPATVSLVNATARLAEGHLRSEMEASDERLRARNLAHLSALRGQPGALLTPSGRVIAAEPHGPWPSRIALPDGAERVALDGGREAIVEPVSGGYLLRLPRSAAHRDRPRLPALSLSFLGERPTAVLDGEPLALTLRRAELLALLALRPEGLTADQLALQLYGEVGNPTTVRAEVHRLRSQLGEAAMSAKPYRLRAEVDADFLTVRDALRRGELRAAVRACRSPLLVRSDAPAIRAEREQLLVTLRSAVLGQADADLLWQFAQTESGRDDIEVAERLTELLSRHDPRRSEAEARLAWLLGEHD